LIYYFAFQATADVDDYEEVEKDIYELLEKETELRQAAEARAMKAEQGVSIALHRIKDLEILLFLFSRSRYFYDLLTNFFLYFIYYYYYYYYYFYFYFFSDERTTEERCGFGVIWGN
jgi:hypothetical protein